MRSASLHVILTESPTSGAGKEIPCNGHICSFFFTYLGPVTRDSGTTVQNIRTQNMERLSPIQYLSKNRFSSYDRYITIFSTHRNALTSAQRGTKTFSGATSSLEAGTIARQKS